MKIFPWEWGHWLIFSSSFVQCPRLSGGWGGGRGFTLTGALQLIERLTHPVDTHIGTAMTGEFETKHEERR